LQDELNDDGDCSLREAISAANDNTTVDACPAGEAVITDTITFDVAGTITVTSQLSVTAGGPLVIDGGEVITTSGGGTTRVWWVEMGGILNMNRLVVANGYVGGHNAGGISNWGTLTLNFTRVVENSDGGIHNNGGTLTLNHTQVFENIGRGTINESGSLFLNYSTISSNSGGGGMGEGGFSIWAHRS